jgi:hypothetical protein
VAAITREELDAKLDGTQARVEAVETRINANIDSLRSDIKSSRDGVRADIDGLRTEFRTEIKHLATTQGMVWTMGGFTFAGALLLLAVITYGTNRFDGGIQAVAVSVQQAKMQKTPQRKRRKRRPTPLKSSTQR